MKLKIIISILILLLFVSPVSAWWNMDWNYRREIQINHNMVDANMSNFPVMVSILQPNINNDASDIRITDYLNNPVAREIESYNITSTVLVFFFNATSVSNTINTSFWMYYNNSEATEPLNNSIYGSHKVWDNNYINVYHMNNDPSSASPQIKDSSSNSNDGTVYTTMDTGDLINVTHGKGIKFESSKLEAIRIQDDALSGLNYCTLEFDVSISTHLQTVLISSAWTNPHPIYIEWDFGSTSKIVFDQSGAHSTTNTYDLTGHHHITYVKNATSWMVYIDGVYQESITSVDYPAIDTTSGHEYAIFKFVGIERSFLNGVAYDVKLSKISRSSNYITTTYNNFYNPTATGTNPFFTSFGIIEEKPPFIPPIPINLDYSRGFFWVNHTWDAGTGNVTDSYNVSHNGTWYNDTTNSYYNSGDIGDGGYSEILIYAYNNTGRISEGYITQNISAQPYIPPPTPINLAYIKGTYWVNYTWAAGLDGLTTSYNVSHNGSWVNGSSATWFNSGDVGRNGISTIIVYAYNGIISEEFVTQTISTKLGMGYEQKMSDNDIKSFYYPFMGIFFIFLLFGVVRYIASR